MATKTIKAPVIAQTSGTALGNIFNGGSDYRTVTNSMDVGYLIFDNSSFQNKSKACSITNTYLSFKMWGENQNGFNADCDCTVTLDYNLFTVSSKNGTDYSGTAGTYLFSNTFSYGANGKNENFQDRSYTWDSQYNNLFSDPNLYPALHVSMAEDNFWTKALVWMKELYITFTYLERYYANFYVDGALYDWRAIETGSTFTITPPTKQYYNFVGWQSSEDGKTYTTLPARNSTTEVNYTAVWELINYTITWNYNGGTYLGKNFSTSSQNALITWSSNYEMKFPTRPGYVFVGWDAAQPGGLISQNGMKGLAENTSGFIATNHTDGFTRYTFTYSQQNEDTWRWIRFGDYAVKTTDSVTITGQIRIIRTPVSLKLYHGQAPNDWNNSPRSFGPNEATGEWQRFSITRNGYSADSEKACFEIYTGNLNGTSGTIEFDLREIKIIINNDTSKSACRLNCTQLTSDVTFNAIWRPATYVSYDTMLNYLKWKDTDLTTTSGSGGKISNISDTGFMLTATSGDAYTEPFSPMYYTETDKDYIVSFFGYPTNNSGNYNIFSFYYNEDGKGGYDYTLTPNSAGFSSAGLCNYTFKAKSPYGRIRVGTTTNGQEVQFADFRLYPADAKYSYMRDSLSSFYRNYRESWGTNNTMPTPTRTGYTFKSWNTKPNGSGTTYTSSSLFPTRDIVLFSQWEINKYTATFYDYEGNIIETKSVDYNTTPTCSKIPTRPSTNEYDYTFDGWIINETTPIGPITANTNYYPKWKQTDRLYTITWVNWDGAILETDSLKYGDIPVYEGNSPTKDPIPEGVYNWIGWEIDVSPVTKDIIYTAKFELIKNKYIVTWHNWDGKQIGESKEYEHGDVPVFDYDFLPTRPQTESHYYEFLDWDATPGDNDASGLQPVTSHITYTAVYTEHLRSFNLEIKASPTQGGATIGTGTYNYNDQVVIQAIPSRGYLFHQWSDGVKTPQRAITITQNATYTAEFKKILCYWNTTPITEAYLNTTQITI